MAVGSQDTRAPLTGRVSFFGEGRAGRVLLQLGGFYLAVTVLFVPLAGLVSVATAGLENTLRDLLVAGVPVVGAVGVITVFMYRTGRWTHRDAGWPEIPTGVRWFVRTSVLGLAMAGGAILIGLTLGGGGFVIADEPGNYGVSAAVLLAGLTVAALAEEVLFRGYPLVRLSRIAGRAGASLILAMFFGLMHLWNPDPTLLGLGNIALASLVLSAVFFTDGGLAAAWGLHLGWNAGLMLADVPVSGIAFDLPGLDYRDTGPEWITGGGFGPEGGLAASIVMVAALVWITSKWITTEESVVEDG